MKLIKPFIQSSILNTFPTACFPHSFVRGGVQMEYGWGYFISK